jgi:hypothetical protein
VQASANSAASGASYAASSTTTDSSPAYYEIDLTDVTAARAFIFTGALVLDGVNIEQSTFGDLGVIVPNGLAINDTTTTHSTTLIGLGTGDTFDGSGNSFADLYTQGLTLSPGSSLTSASPTVAPALSRFGAHAPTSTPPVSAPAPASKSPQLFDFFVPTTSPRASTPAPASGTPATFKPVSGTAGDGNPFG